jgi:lysophospholipase L1-like esterase
MDKRIMRIIGLYLQPVICFTIAALCTPVVFPLLLPTSLTFRENAFLLLVSAAMFILGLLFLLNVKNKKKTALIWFYILALGLIPAVILEVGLRFVLKPAPSLLLYRTAPENTQAFRLKPNLDITTQIANTPVSILTSSRGLRISAAGKNEGPKTTRIAFVGDSFTFGLWADSAEKSFPSLVGEVLGADKYSTYNLGVPGYGIEDSLQQLKHHWTSINPDLVVLAIFNGNDFLDTFLGMERYSVRADGLLELNKPLVETKVPVEFRSPSFQLESWLYDNLYTARAAAQFLFTFRGSEQQSTSAVPTRLPELPLYSSSVIWSLKEYPDFAENARRITMEKIREFAEYCTETQAASLLIVTIPHFAQVLIPDHFPPRYIVSRPQSFVEEFARENEIPYLDLLPVFHGFHQLDETPLYYYFDGHFNSLGHRVTADAIAETIRTKMIK